VTADIYRILDIYIRAGIVRSYFLLAETPLRNSLSVMEPEQTRAQRGAGGGGAAGLQPHMKIKNKYRFCRHDDVKRAKLLAFQAKAATEIG
jgi:hypothetical protein